MFIPKIDEKWDKKMERPQDKRTNYHKIKLNLL